MIQMTHCHLHQDFFNKTPPPEVRTVTETREQICLVVRVPEFSDVFFYALLVC
jgi:hypothetical protein